MSLKHRWNRRGTVMESTSVVVVVICVVSIGVLIGGITGVLISGALAIAVSAARNWRGARSHVWARNLLSRFGLSNLWNTKLAARVLSITAVFTLVAGIISAAVASLTPAEPLRGKGYDVLIDLDLPLEDTDFNRALLVSGFLAATLPEESSKDIPLLESILENLGYGELVCVREQLNIFLRQDAENHQRMTVVRAVLNAPGLDFQSQVEDAFVKITLGVARDWSEIINIRTNMAGAYLAIGMPVLEQVDITSRLLVLKKLNEDLAYCRTDYQ